MNSKRLKILIIGASGTIGSAVKDNLSERHDVITAGTKSGDVNVDITDPASIKQVFEQLGPLDAVITTLGKATFAPFEELQAAPLEESQHLLGIKDKLMGQVNVAQYARDYLVDGGSITLTSGILNEHPVPGSVSPSMINGALEAFVKAAAMEMPRGIRINIVSPSVLKESLGKYGPFFRGFKPVVAEDVALAYSRSVESLVTGQVLKVW
ncbi:short chain dehydrogenase [Litchfieldella qijiaojingensis]|uniref:Short chain dehydrogenase n=1 Tax=Litchfieldella qijiaojingensis TaxID=980347 RepID=A0ABQ2ZCS9_9GAMM|nr:short chain dehydrogenase [Halomonas qijiaojingensis]GGY11075.1 short chain dehydrogenase [Halomonas qijiaojingensis]